MLELAETARLNKLYLAYLRAVGDLLGGELAREEARYGWFLRSTVEVMEALWVTTLYKFRRPIEHVSVDSNILVSGRYS